jgi:hypothetical protein
MREPAGLGEAVIIDIIMATRDVRRFGITQG